MLLLDHGLGQDADPRPVPQGHLLQLLAVDGDGVVGRLGRVLVGDGEDGIGADLAGDVQVRLHLLALELVAGDLDLEQGAPVALAAGDQDHAVRAELLAVELERALDEGLDAAGRHAERLEQGAAELVDGGHHRQQGRCGVALLGADAGLGGDGDQPGNRPLLILEHGRGARACARWAERGGESLAGPPLGQCVHSSNHCHVGMPYFRNG